jgi:putative intracellular protease/amidase
LKFNVILFDGFVALDALGPVEIIGNIGTHYDIDFFSEHGGLISTSKGLKVETLPLSDISNAGVILVPGGMGTRREVDNAPLISALKGLAERAEYVLTVCTGAALLAKTGLLKGRRATTNKMAFDWAASQDAEVIWVRKARWVVDGKYYTSSGVTAGMDMALGFAADRHGIQVSEAISKGIEYIWNRDKDEDPFAQA